MNSNDCLEKQPLCDEMLTKMNAWWRAANYLAAGQLYLLAVGWYVLQESRSGGSESIKRKRTSVLCTGI